MTHTARMSIDAHVCMQIFPRTPQQTTITLCHHETQATVQQIISSLSYSTAVAASCREQTTVRSTSSTPNLSVIRCEMVMQ